MTGQEMSCLVGTDAEHQVHSNPGSGCINHSQGRPTEARALGGCAICAMSFWIEDLYDLQLFTKPADAGLDGADEAKGSPARASTTARGSGT